MADFANLKLADRYLLESELGRGGMATVWRAQDLRHQRTVAIKILHPELAGAIGVDRFLREVRLTAQLQHPNIVPILDSGVIPAGDGTQLPWYAMTFLEGESLRARKPRADLHFQLHLRCDPPFGPIRQSPGFRALLTLPAPPPGRGC